MMEKEIERWGVVEYRRAAAISTGVPSASPMTNGNKPPASASHGTAENTMTARAKVHTTTPRKKVRRSPSASVIEPASNVNTVIAGDQTQPTSTTRAKANTRTPKNNVRRSPSASAIEPAINVNTVIAGAQTQPTSAPAD